MRRITSLTAALTFLLVVLTSIILYIVPQGRVAYWADWRLWGLSKTDWGNIHINLGFLFLIALGLHIYYNWKPLMAYLKDRARRFKLFTREFNIALAITVLCTLGSYFLIPPFSWVMALNDHFKETASAKYGEPPYGHAELSTLKSFTGKMNLDLANSLILLEESGYRDASADATLAEIAKRNGVAPQQIFMVIQPAALQTEKTQAAVNRMPETPAPGTGSLSLDEFCAQYQLDTEKTIQYLKSKKISASGRLTLKAIAAANDMSPIDLFEVLKELRPTR